MKMQRRMVAMLALLSCLAARPAYADIGDALDGLLYLMLLSSGSMSFIGACFATGGVKNKILCFFASLFACLLASPLIGYSVLSMGVYGPFPMALLVALIVVRSFNRATAYRGATKEEELKRAIGNNDIPSIPDAEPQKKVRAEALSPQVTPKPAAPKDKSFIIAQANWIVGVALIYPVIAGFIVRNNSPDGVTIQHFFLVFAPPIISFWWLPIKTYGARIMYMIPLAAAYAAAVSIFLIFAFDYDDCPVRRVAMGSECVPKQWEASAQRYFREHPDVPYAVPSGGR